MGKTMFVHRNSVIVGIAITASFAAAAADGGGGDVVDTIVLLSILLFLLIGNRNIRKGCVARNAVDNAGGNNVSIGEAEVKSLLVIASAS